MQATAHGALPGGLTLTVPSVGGAVRGFQTAVMEAKTANAARPFVPAFAQGAFSVSARAAGGAVDEVEQRLVKLTNEVIQDFKANKIDLSERQYGKLGTAPWLRWAFQGQVMDKALKVKVGADDFFIGRDALGRPLDITKQGLEGPDFLNKTALPQEGDWYDLTTQAAWRAHQKLYTDELNYGAGVGIFYR